MHHLDSIVFIHTHIHMHTRMHTLNNHLNFEKDVYAKITERCSNAYMQIDKFREYIVHSGYYLCDNTR